MHDCAKTQEQLVDLLLGELTPEEARLVAAEAEACADCRREHAGLAETLRAFDRVSDAALPEESFWAGYHERLREKITAEATGGGGAKVLMFRLPGTRFRFTPMQAAAALLVIGVIGGGLWMALRSGGTSPGITNIIQPLPETAGTQAPRKAEPQPMPERIPQEAPTPIPVDTQPRRKSPTSTPKSRPRTEETVAPQKNTRPTELPLLAVGLPTPTFTPDTVSHFEKAQFMLRTLRNSTDADVAETIAYERQRSRGLLTRNIVLRREAERSGNIPLGNVLNQLEPLLIDIANLPDKPSKEDIQVIRERMRRKEIIATLQTYTRLNDTPNPSSIGQ